MPPFFNTEIEWILALRDALPGLTGLFELFTNLGSQMFFLVMLPFVYWCLDRRTGARLTVLFLLTAYTNALTKLAFALPRPFDVAPDRLAPLFPDGIAAAKETYEATSKAFPSGHTQTATTVWGFLASQIAGLRPAGANKGYALLAALRPVLLAVAALLIVMVPLSRVYLGVHFPHDLAGGYVLGALVLGLFLWLHPRVEAALASWTLVQHVALAALVPLLLLIPIRDENTVTAAATLLGMGMGFALERRRVGFETGPTPWRELWKVALRFALGIGVMLALYAGLKAAFAALVPATAGENDPAVLALRFIRYTLMGLWGGLGAPWLFVTLGLAPRRATGQSAV